MQPIVTALVCCQEVDGKTLLLKIAYTLVTGHVDIKLELTWELLPCRQAFKHWGMFKKTLGRESP